VVDSHKADFWNQVFDNITVHKNLAVNRGGHIAWAMRKNSPKLKALVNEFIKSHKVGTLHGNILIKRYLKDASYVKDALSSKDRQRFESMVKIFHKYAGQYGFDFLMVAAQGYQESRLDQSVRSKAGAVGVMQLLPTTAKDPNVGIPDIEKLESNIHAGTKYLRFLLDRYFKDAPMTELNKWLFAFAAYNAGPARIAQLREKAPDMGLDPNRWFGHVEVVAAKTVGREPVDYVSNIYKYYVAYRTIIEQSMLKDQLQQVEK
jgi:membrane-bound lytic murein transglycosylase MltF